MEATISGKNIADYVKQYNEMYGISSHADTILQQLFEQSSYRRLRHNVEPPNFNTKKRQHATDPVDIIELKFVPWSKSTTLAVKSVAKSGVKHYDVSITFPKVKYEKADSASNIAFTGSDGNKYYIRPINLNEANVKVRCTCLDFYWRFAYYNNVDKSLIGKPPKPYVRKTDRPPVNPNKVPGVCKHLIKTFSELHRTGILK